MNRPVSRKVSLMHSNKAVNDVDDKPPNCVIKN